MGLLALTRFKAVGCASGYAEALEAVGLGEEPNRSRRLPARGQECRRLATYAASRSRFSRRLRFHLQLVEQTIRSERLGLNFPPHSTQALGSCTTRRAAL